MEQNYAVQIASYLENGCHHDPKIRSSGKQSFSSFKNPVATEYITQAEQNLPQYGSILLQIVSGTSFSDNTKLLSAITLKNYVTKHYKFNEDLRNKVPTEYKNDIKSTIIDLLIVSPDGIKKQLAETVNAICIIDYPENWPNLLSYIVSKLNLLPINSIKDLFSVVDLIFKRYCYEHRSDDLWSEIIFSLKEFAPLLTTIFTKFTQQLPSLSSNDPSSNDIYGTLILCVKMFYSLNFQDLPEFFEDQMSVWMSSFNSIILLPLVSSSVNIRPLLTKLQRHSCDCIQLYIARYTDEFSNYVMPFAESVCRLVLPLPCEQQYDSLASSALNYLCTVGQDVNYATFFTNAEIMESLCRDIIVPSLQLNDADCNLFFEGSFEYIERDLESSNLRTRRKAAVELLTALCSIDESRVGKILSGFIDQLLEKYNSNRRENWKLMDAAILLVTSLASPNNSNAPSLVDPKMFFISRFQAELNITSEQDLNTREYAFIQSDLLRFLITFKNRFNDEEKCTILEKSVVFMRSPMIVVHSYAAVLIEKYLSINEFVSTFQRMETKIEPFLSIYYPAVLRILSNSQLDDNVYAIHSLMKVTEATKSYTFRHLDMLRVYFRDGLPSIISNPSKSMFIHYFFEVFCQILVAECMANASALVYYNNFCLQNFGKVFSSDVTDLQPYALQVMAILIEQHPKGNLSDVYRNFLSVLLAGTLYESIDLIPSFFRIMKAYLFTDSMFLIQSVKMETLFNIAHRPIKMCGFERYGFSFLASILIAWPNESIPLFEYLFKSLITRFCQTKILTFKKVFRSFIFNLINIFGSPYVFSLLQKTSSLQPLDFICKHLYTRVVTFNDDIERNIYFVGLSKMLFETPSIYAEKKYYTFWSAFIVVAINLIEPDPTLNKRQQFIDTRIEHLAFCDENFRISVSILSSAGSINVDPIRDVDYKIVFGQMLKNFALNNPAIMNSLIEECPVNKREHVIATIRKMGAFGNTT